ncbi:TetR/AcrR family transcriptional regulator [Aerococcus urinae]|uniref:TetR/AcrR family transcriptional regulator n=1 Tax=Aerococcus urinae TaxID=1376 RepID=UPI0018A7ACBF|nr:TetR/AcrR family transcriptional regulator [Aerococcus urinae]
MNTKIIIFLALEKLLKSKPFEKITVIEIAQAAHISRATFYRHFEDKFDLANWYYRQKAEEVFQDTSQDSPWYIFYGLSLFMGQEDATFMQVMLNERGGKIPFLISSLISFMTTG